METCIRLGTEHAREAFMLLSQVIGRFLCNADANLALVLVIALVGEK
jgi:hypothetical protein